MGVDTFGLSLLAVPSSSGSSPPSVLALLLGLPTLRLRSDYLAIVTIAAGEILRLVLRPASFREHHRRLGRLQDFADAFFDLNPFRRGHVSVISATARPYSLEPTLWVLCVGWDLVALAA